MAAEGEALDGLWDALAQQLVAVGDDPGRQRLYLAKLVLLLARELDDAEKVRALAAIAARDLE